MGLPPGPERSSEQEKTQMPEGTSGRGTGDERRRDRGDTQRGKGQEASLRTDLKAKQDSGQGERAVQRPWGGQHQRTAEGWAEAQGMLGRGQRAHTGPVMTQSVSGPGTDLTLRSTWRRDTEVPNRLRGRPGSGQRTVTQSRKEGTPGERTR